tara:strand:- start:18 stop:554 length:537 start_codon:yes stop_codon:yes gene_type:complete
MSATNFPSAPKNFPPIPSHHIPIDENQLKFDNALHRAFDILFYHISLSITRLSHDKSPNHIQNQLIHLWQDKVSEHHATHPDSRKNHPQLYLPYYAGHHIDLLYGEDIDIPLNKAGKPIIFTNSTLLSKNSSLFRQYLKDQGYLPDGLCLLIFRQKTNWTYSIIITRDNNGPPTSDWD